MLSKLFTNWPVVLDTHTAQAGTPVYVNVETVSADGGLVDGLARVSGQKYPSFGFLRSGSPVAEFTSYDLKEFLDAVGIESMLIDSGVSGDGLIIYQMKYADGESRMAAASSEHHQITIGDGMIYPVSLTLPHQGDGIITAAVFAKSSDGTTHPFVFSETANLPSGVNPEQDALYTMGKVDLNGTEVTGKSQVTINFGVNVTSMVSSDSDQYPTHVAVDTVTPSIEVMTSHIDVTDTLTEEGGYYTAGQVSVYAKKRAAGSGYVADVTAEHIKFTLGKCRVTPGQISGDPKTIGLRITPWDSPGDIAQLAVNTASAIT